MTRAYEVTAGRSWHLPDHGVALVAGAAVAGVSVGVLAAVAVAALALLIERPRQAARWCAAACGVVGVVGATAGGRAWHDAVPRHLGPFSGWAQVATDPAVYGSGVRLTLEIDGQRFDSWSYGSRADTMAHRQAGEWVWVQGERTALAGDARRAQLRHVVGRFQLDVAADTLPGSPLTVAGNRVRSALRRSAEVTMGPDLAALFTGLVIGDDSRQSPEMIQEFRASGLSHLTAVSGQNVAFLLAAALPVLRRLRPASRWLVTVGLIAWFMAVTRFEPSVLRAGLMAILAATAFVLGRQPRPVRLLAWSVTALVLIDPLLVWSVGFWLSVGATAGVCVIGPWLASHLPGAPWWRTSLGITLGAQCGVALPSLLVFHRLPVVSVVANLVAVPVAGGVMLYGLPVGLVAGWLPGPLAQVMMAPAVIGTRWVATVARVAAHLEPSGWRSWCAWMVVVVVLGLVVLHRSRAQARRVPV
ncbi:MAG: ComEC/Rec2 family competence protein [Actinobacteria bacterium]|nr:ComEC/Rec2 family competence protein [Actinomycetota bacterium]